MKLGGAFASSLILVEFILTIIVRIVTIINQLRIPTLRHILNYWGFLIQIILIITIIFHSFFVVIVIICLFVIVILLLILLVVLVGCMLVESVAIISFVVVLSVSEPTSRLTPLVFASRILIRLLHNLVAGRLLMIYPFDLDWVLGQFLECLLMQRRLLLLVMNDHSRGCTKWQVILFDNDYAPLFSFQCSLLLSLSLVDHGLLLLLLSPRYRHLNV